MTSDLEEPHKWDRLVIQAEITVDGCKHTARVTVEAQAWMHEDIRKDVLARLKAHLVETLISEIKPTIRISC